MLELLSKLKIDFTRQCALRHGVQLLSILPDGGTGEEDGEAEEEAGQGEGETDQGEEVHGEMELCLQQVNTRGVVSPAPANYNELLYFSFSRKNLKLSLSSIFKRSGE